jgi:urea transporter
MSVFSGEKMEKRKRKIVMEHPMMVFTRSVLRGCGQVMFQKNAVTGLIFFAGIFYNSTTLGICALLGTVTSTGTALLLGADKDLIQDGLYGFNGTLAGIAIPFYFSFEPTLLLLVVLNGAFSTIVMAALLQFLGKWEVAPLTAPFVLSTWVFLLSAHTFHLFAPGPLLVPALPHSAPVAELGRVSGMTLWEGLTKGVGEVMFQDHVITGCLFVVGLAVNSRISALLGLLGSMVGLLTAWILKAPESSLHLGLYGFNSVLCGIALYGVFYSPGKGVGACTIAAMIMCAITTAAMGVLLAPMGIPALTGPFVLVTWFFLFAGRQFSVLEKAMPKPSELSENMCD